MPKHLTFFPPKKYHQDFNELVEYWDDFHNWPDCETIKSK